VASGARPRPVPHHVDEVSPSSPRQHELFIRGNASVFASPGLSAGAFLRSPYAVGREPDVQITVHPWDKYGRVWGLSYAGIMSMEARSPAISPRSRRDLRPTRGSSPPSPLRAIPPTRSAPLALADASAQVANNRPRSRGRIRLRSSAINEPPLFDGPYLKDMNDSAPLRCAPDGGSEPAPGAAEEPTAAVALCD
jgi:hypothetical protein